MKEPRLFDQVPQVLVDELVEVSVDATALLDVFDRDVGEDGQL